MPIPLGSPEDGVDVTDDKRHRKESLRHDLGLSRRELLRRGAIAGGTLLWVAPTIQSLAPIASAQQACCPCVSGSGRGAQSSCTVDVLTQSECVARCGGADTTAFYGVGNYSCVDGNCVPVGDETSGTSTSGPTGETPEVPTGPTRGRGAWPD